MTGYNVSLQGNITGFKKVSSAITQYNLLSASGAKEQNTFANAVSVTNGKLGTYLTGLNGAKASLGGYVISLVGATVKTVALKVATIALNSAITMGASLIISGVVSAISKWIHKTENMISASEDAIEKIKSINDELKNNQKTISDTAKRYAELAQGVDQLTGKNISLSNENYEEFLNLSNQIAEIFPELPRIYKDNGDAIVQLSGDVDTIVGSLQNLIEAQRDLANRQIVDELPTVFKGVAAKSDKYEQQLSDLESRRDTLVKSLGDLQSKEFSSNFMESFTNKWIEISGDNLEVISQIKDDYIKILKEANIDFEELTPTYEVKDLAEVPVGFTIKINAFDEDVEKAKNTIYDKIKDLAVQYEKDIKKLNEEINTTNEKNKANWTSLSSSIFAWLSTDDSFKVMDDTMQATVQNIVNSLDWGSLDFSSWEDAKQYIQENILSLFNTSEGKETLADIEVMFGIQTQFNNGDITVEQYQQKLKDFLNSIENLPPETKKSILLLFGIQTNDDGTTTSDVDTMVENVKKKLKGTEFDDKVGELSLEDLKIAADLEVSDDTIQSWDDLIERIEKVKSEDNKTDILSFSDAWEKLKNSTDDTTKGLADDLMELAESGKLTVKALSEADKSEFFKNAGISAEEATNKILDMLSSTEKLSAAHKGISSLENAYKEMTEDGFVLAKTLEDLPDVFRELKGFNLFAEIVGNPENTKEEMQQAFNDITTEYIITQRTLTGLVNASEAEVKSYIANLKAMGITNAEEVVRSAQSNLELINSATSEYTKAYNKYLETKNEADLEYLKTSASNNGKLLTVLGDTYQTDYDNWCDLLKTKIDAYNDFVNSLSKSQKKLASIGIGASKDTQFTEAMNVINDVEKNGVIKLPTLLGSTGRLGLLSNSNKNNSSLLDLIKQETNKNASYTQEQYDLAKSYIDAYAKWETAVKTLELDLTTANVDFSKFEYKAPDGSSKDGSSKEDTTDYWKKEFDDQLATLKHQLAMNQITEAQYYNTLDALNKKYFANREEYLSEYRQYEEEVYKGLLSVQDKALNAINDLIDLRKEMIRDMKEDEIEALEEIIKAEKEKLKAINKSIDARKKAIELLKDEKTHDEEMAERNKAISDIQVQIDRLALDNSASAQKKRRQLEEQLTEKKKDLADYISDYEYDKAMEALDNEAEMAEQEYEQLEENLNNQIDAIETYLDDEKQLLLDATNDINGMNENLFNNMKNWAYETTGSVQEVVDKWKEAQKALELYDSTNAALEIKNTLAQSNSDNKVVNNNAGTVSTSGGGGAKPSSTPTPNTNSNANKNTNTPSTRYYTIRSSADTMWSLATRYYGDGRKWTKIQQANGGIAPESLRIGQKLIIPYKKGTKKVPEDQLALTDEAGEELILHANEEGNLRILTKGSSVIPADLTENLMKWGEMNPDLLTQNLKINLPPVNIPDFKVRENVPIVNIGDININGNMGNLTKSDLNDFRKGIVNDVYESMQKNRVKSGRY